ncbi:MAG TPA: 23S rRNA (pseudouridine(1915)-N(3))-methyltransferase RlmH [Acetobacteraceae bacterium]|nr:23S rRNA (pseudouridine(1915)-N(3))-methyltransferase RlmH [Acetobacteraceae bacterium]
MHIIAVGRLRNGPEAELFERYNSRLRPRLTVLELKEERGSAAVIKREEGAALLRALPPDGFAVALDLGGQVLDSEGFAGRLASWQGLGRPVCFLIGGAEGLDAPVISRANYILSLGAMTWPHFLIRAMLAEQIYRAQAIAQGHPYHRSGRPGNEPRAP